MGVALLASSREAHQIHHPVNFLRKLLFRNDFVNNQRLFQNIDHTLARVQRGIRILKNHLHLFAQAVEIVLPVALDVFSLKFDLPRGSCFQPAQGSAQRGLSAAGLAHQAQCLTRKDRQIHAVHSLDISDCLGDDAAANRIVQLQVPRLENGDLAL